MIDFFKRLDKYMKYKGLNDNKITMETGISNGLIGKGRNRGSFSQDSISKILLRYPELDANWLLLGTGSMLRENLENPRSGQDENTEYKEKYFELLEENRELNRRINELRDKIDGLNKEALAIL